MNYKSFLVLIFLLSNITYSQSKTYFIKYKNEVEKSSVEEKIKTQNLLKSLHKTGSPIQKVSVNHFAKNLGKDDENLSRIIKVTFANQEKADEYLQQLQSDNTIEYIQPSVTYKIESVPNDSLLSDQWGLEIIRAHDAWNITQGEDSIVVGVVDTGIDYLHPDLKNKIFINEGETGKDNLGVDKKNNGIDDDGNGFIDDFMGWDFTDRIGFPDDTTSDYLNWDNDPFDEHFHGTSVAGIIGAQTNNEVGMAGTAPNIRILNLRAFDRNGTGEEDDVSAAILYAVETGVKVINMSFGDYTFSYVLRDVIKYAHSRNIVLIASAGNSNSQNPHYPSGYTEVISIGNSTQNDNVASGSNYGSTIDLVAPGTGILSTILNGEYDFVSGTSFSAPFVAAAAALILSLNNFTNEEVKQIIKSTADDIGQAGWDLKSGAGRLNMFRALSILSPAKINFNYPLQDFATLNDTMNINASVMSPYFVKFDLMYGEGVNPAVWNILTKDVQYQIRNEKIYTLNTTTLNEGTYTLRLLVSLNNGSTTEERVNFHIQRTAPEMELVGAGPIYYGSRSTLMGEIYTSNLAVTRMYYRQKGSGEFNFVSLDGFATNNQFVKQLHYGFIPKQLVHPNTFYEIYFEAENLVGLKTVLNDDGNFFEFKTDRLYEQIPFTEMEYNLPQGSIFSSPVNFLSSGFNEILFDPVIPDSEDAGAQVTYAVYKLNNNSFEKKILIKDKIPRTVDDFNNNGRTDLLSHFGSRGYIDEYETGSDSLTNKFTNSTFFPILAADINNNGSFEALSNLSGNALVLWQIKQDLSIQSLDTLHNFTIDSSDINYEFYNNVYRNSIVADTDGDEINEIWTIDADGDMFSYIIADQGLLVEKYSFNTQFRSNQNGIISSGDFDGDGIKDISVLLNSNSIANYFFVMIFNYKNNRLNILYENVFLDQSAEYGGLSFSKYYQTLKMADVDNDNKDELLLNIYPYAYMIKHDASGSKIIFYKEEINTESIFSGDLNGNGVTEIALQTPEGIRFYEFAPSLKPNTPGHFSGHSIDSSTIKLTWSGSSQKYFIYKGTDKNSLALYDSTTADNFIDINVAVNKTYYYAVQAVDLAKDIPVSDWSNVIEVYSHKPGTALRAESNSAQSVMVYFSERVTNTIESLNSFEVPGVGIPNSVTASSQYSYLLSYTHQLPAGENRLVVKNLRDYFRSEIKTDTLMFTVTPLAVEQEFFISSHEIVNPFKIKIAFNVDVEESGTENILNYIFEPENKIVSVTVDPADKKIIYLDLAKEKPVGSIGREYRLKIENLTSSSGIKINQGAGSYIVLTGSAKNLDDVYVYPSPIKLAAGNEKIMFANLPQKAKITILTLEGKQLISFEEKDGNGGVEYNLQDDNGSLLNSGVYIYRIIRLDNQNNEVEEKIGKFAVIR